MGEDGSGVLGFLDSVENVTMKVASWPAPAGRTVAFLGFEFILRSSVGDRDADKNAFWATCLGAIRSSMARVLVQLWISIPVDVGGSVV